MFIKQILENWYRGFYKWGLSVRVESIKLNKELEKNTQPF
jgi:hypothetical protein